MDSKFTSAKSTQSLIFAYWGRIGVNRKVVKIGCQLFQAKIVDTSGGLDEISIRSGEPEGGLLCWIFYICGVCSLENQSNPSHSDIQKIIRISNFINIICEVHWGAKKCHKNLKPKFIEFCRYSVSYASFKLYIVRKHTFNLSNIFTLIWRFVPFAMKLLQ